MNIAMLRMWLSLGDRVRGRPLRNRFPNLDFKVVKGDSLLGPDPGQLNQSRYQIELSDLPRFKARYMPATADKDELRREIADAEERLRNDLGVAAVPDGVVDWRIEFAEVFANGGFDVVIANPPYIQLQRDGGKLGRMYKDAGFATFTRTGDIYQLFYERGCQLLMPDRGLLAYITSNSWLKAEYGKRLRRYFSERHTPLRLLELGKDIFESAIVDSSVLLLREGAGGGSFHAVDMDRLPGKEFPPDESLWGRARPDGETPWSILSRIEQSVMDKMLTVGTPLKDWDIAIYRGITTGLNDAFIIDNQTKEGLIAQDPRSEDIIKPVLRGRDIERYGAKWAGMWLIDTHNGFGGVPPIEIDDYPAIKAYLNKYYEQLEKRYDKGRTPYNLRNCAYHEDFTKEKLLWIELVNDGRFAYDNSGFYGEATTFLLTGESIKFLCAVLNSKLIRWFLDKVAPTSGMGTLRWKKVYVERLPIPRTADPRQQQFSQLVDRALMAKAGNRDSGTSEIEAEIDARVYQLYGLTPSEITAVEQRL